jgi:8-oxo-dGTP pyrophosphatase MutT (NUDIX family)
MRALKGPAKTLQRYTEGRRGAQRKTEEGRDPARRGMEIECTSIYGNKVPVPRSRLRLRAAVYGVIVHGGKVLLIRSRHGGRYYLPGGGIEVGERIEDALKREVREETGIEVEVEGFVHFCEDFFYYDPGDKAYHSLLFYYVCRPMTFDVSDDAQVDDEDAEQPRWVEMAGLQACDFQSHGEMVLGLLQS